MKEDPDSMANGVALELTYIGVFVLSRNHIVVPAIVDKYADDRRDHALVQHWLVDDWVQHLVDGSICSVCALGSNPAEVFNIGVGGHVVVARIPGGESHEDIDTSPRGPNYSEMLRCAKVISGVVHVAGMARQVYRRDARGAWSAIDAGVYLPRGARKKATGFLDLDGFGLSDIYAAGYKGEIWSYDGAVWLQRPSPTNVALNKVLVSSAGNVFIAGLAGTLLRGRADKWTLIAEGQTSEDFWGLAEFKGSVYVATNYAVYKVVGDDLVVLNLGQQGDDDVSTSYLHAGDGILMSVGDKDILRTDDGVHWVAMPKP
jgi:hypothetical protein